MNQSQRVQERLLKKKECHGGTKIIVKLLKKETEHLKGKETPHDGNINPVKKIQAVVWKLIKTAKQACWRQYCNSIGRETLLSDIWGMVRKMSRIRRRNYTVPVLISNTKTAVNNIEKAVLLAETLVKTYSSENLSDLAKQARDNMLALNPGISIRKAAMNESLDVPFSLFELKRATQNVKQSSPGNDEIC